MPYIPTEDLLKLKKPPTLGRMIVLIDNDVWGEMKKIRDEYINGDYQEYPWCGLLGKDVFGHVRKIIHINRVDVGGCEEMPDLDVNMLSNAATTLAYEGLCLSGVVRVGNFQIERVRSNDSGRGESLADFHSIAPDFYIISFAMNGVFVETWNGRSKLQHGYKVVKRIKGGSDGYEEIIWYEEGRIKADRRSPKSKPEQEKGISKNKAEEKRRSPKSKQAKEGCIDNPEERNNEESPSRSHVRETGSSAGAGYTERANDTGTVPEQSGRVLRAERSSEPQASEDGLHPTGWGHRHEDGEIKRRKIAEQAFENFKDTLLGVEFEEDSEE